MLPFVGTPEAAYATKPNITFPGTQAQATAAESTADTRVDERLADQADNVTVAIAAGAIEVAT